MGQEFVILTIDDEPSVCKIVSKILQRAGFKVLTANSPLKGIEIAASEEIDLILLDVNMPIMSGFEVLEKLKESKATRKIPVIMLTCQGELTDFESGHTLGVDDYITKPFEARLLVQRVNRAIVYALRPDEFKRGPQENGES